jgi:hypothetical protein
VLTRQRDGNVEVSHICGSEVSGDEEDRRRRGLQEKSSKKRVSDAIARAGRDEERGPG